MTDENYPPGMTGADLEPTAWDAPDAMPDPTWADVERHKPELALAIDEQFITDHADARDLNDLITELEARRMEPVIRIGDRLVADRAGFRQRRMRGVVIERE